MRARFVQALAILALLHVLTPLVDPAAITLAQAEAHYGETVQLGGRVAAVDPAGSVVRVSLVSGGDELTVLTRGQAPPVGANVTVRGQPAPGQAGPIVWAEGPIRVDEEPEQGRSLHVDELLADPARRAGRPVTVVGTFADGEHTLLGEEGRLPVQPVGIEPTPGDVQLWGRLVYEPARAGYELEATGWRAWTPSPS